MNIETLFSVFSRRENHLSGFLPFYLSIEQKTPFCFSNTYTHRTYDGFLQIKKEKNTQYKSEGI